MANPILSPFFLPVDPLGRQSGKGKLEGEREREEEESPPFWYVVDPPLPSSLISPLKGQKTERRTAAAHASPLNCTVLCALRVARRARTVLRIARSGICPFTVRSIQMRSHASTCPGHSALGEISTLLVWGDNTANPKRRKEDENKRNSG